MIPLYKDCAYSWHGVKNLKEGAVIQSERTS